MSEPSASARRVLAFGKLWAWGDNYRSAITFALPERNSTGSARRSANDDKPSASHSRNVEHSAHHSLTWIAVLALRTVIASARIAYKSGLFSASHLTPFVSTLATSMN